MTGIGKIGCDMRRKAAGTAFFDNQQDLMITRQPVNEICIQRLAKRASANVVAPAGKGGDQLFCFFNKVPRDKTAI